MNLYFSPGACSLSPHIVAQELGLPLTLLRVDGAKKIAGSGADFWKINPKGYVPALELDNGQVLTEGPTIVQYLADLTPDAKLAAPAGSFERYRLQEMLGYLNSEIHKTYSPLFRPEVSPELRADRLAHLTKRYGFIEQRLADGRAYLFGDQFTVADAYLFTLTSWANLVKLDLGDFPRLRAHQDRVATRPSVQAAMAAEGLTKRDAKA